MTAAAPRRGSFKASAMRLVFAVAMTACVADAAFGKRKAPKAAEESNTLPSIGDMAAATIAYLTIPAVMGSLAACLSVLAIAPHRAGEFAKECVGTFVMVWCTFTPGPFLGHLNRSELYGRSVSFEEWLAHMAGVLVADYTCGGPHVNPGVTTAMFVWRKISLLQWMVYVSAQMCGGILAFPALQAASTPYGVTIGGPGIAPGTSLEGAVWSEGAATFVLIMAIFMFCTTWIGSIYHVKQPIVAAVIRACIFVFSKTGPSINPMLATCWAFYASGATWPTDAGHYIVYWVTPMMAASVATLVWSCCTLTGPFELDQGAVYSPKSLKETWDHHFAAFGDKDALKVTKDYSEASILTRFDANTGTKTEFVGIQRIRDAFEGLFGELKDLSQLSAPVIELDATSRTVYLVWMCPSSGIRLATDSFVLDESFKIHRQHLTVHR